MDGWLCRESGRLKERQVGKYMDIHTVFVENPNHLNLTVCIIVGHSLKDLAITVDDQNISLLLINFEGIVSLTSVYIIVPQMC
jgi:hypothetical protein